MSDEQEPREAEPNLKVWVAEEAPGEFLAIGEYGIRVTSQWGSSEQEAMRKTLSALGLSC